MKIRNQRTIKDGQGGFATLIIMTCIIIMVAILSRNASTINILRKTQTLQSRMGQPDWSPASIPGDLINETDDSSENLPDVDTSNMEAENDPDFDTDTDTNTELKEQQGVSEDTSANDPEVVE